MYSKTRLKVKVDMDIDTFENICVQGTLLTLCKKHLLENFVNFSFRPRKFPVVIIFSVTDMHRNSDAIKYCRKFLFGDN